MSDDEPEVAAAHARIDDDDDVNGSVEWGRGWEFDGGGDPFGMTEPKPQETPELTLRQKIVAALMSDDPVPSSPVVKRVRVTSVKPKAAGKGKAKGKKPVKVVKGKKIVKKR